MFNGHSSSYNTHRSFYSKKKASSYFPNNFLRKHKPRKHKRTLIELDDNYFKIAEDRINKAKETIFEL